MVSEHCENPKAFVRLLDVQEQILTLPYFSSVAPPRDTAIPHPLKQSYIFYPNVENVLPVSCEERCFEPRMAFKIPTIVLENFTAVLKETINTWKMRAELERIRCGYFTSREEAFANGWQELIVSIGSGRVKCWYDPDGGNNGQPSSTQPLPPPMGSPQRRSVRMDSRSSSGGNVANSYSASKKPSTYIRVVLEDR
jgi:hypothetical protein